MSTILYSRQNMSCFQEFLEEPYVMDVKNFPKVFKFNYTSLTVTNYNGTSVELYLTNLNTVLVSHYLMESRDPLLLCLNDIEMLVSCLNSASKFIKESVRGPSLAIHGPKR